MELTCNNDVNCRKFFFPSASKQVKTFILITHMRNFWWRKKNAKRKRKKKLSGGVAQHTTKQNYCSSTDSREQTICLRYSLCNTVN